MAAIIVPTDYNGRALSRGPVNRSILEAEGFLDDLNVKRKTLDFIENKQMLLGKIPTVKTTDREVIFNLTGPKHVSTLLSEEYNEGDGVVPGGGSPKVRLVTDNDEMFNAGDVICVPNVQGYEADGTTMSTEPLALYVVSADINMGVQVMAINGKTVNGVPGCLPTIYEGETLLRMGASLSDTEDNCPIVNYVPINNGHLVNYCQKFGIKTSWTLDALSEISDGNFTFSNAVSACKKELLNAIDRTYFFGVPGKVWDPILKEFVIFSSGLWELAERTHRYNGTSLSLEQLSEMFSEFNQYNNKNEVPVIYCGNGLKHMLANLAEEYSNAVTIKRISELEHILTTPYGEVKLIHTKHFDDAGKTWEGLMLYQSALKEYVFNAYKESTVIKDGTKTTTLSKCSCVYYDNPYGLMRIVQI